MFVVGRVSLELIEGWFRIRWRIIWFGEVFLVLLGLIWFFLTAGWIKDYFQNVLTHHSHQRTEGPRDQKIRGPRDQRTKGPEDQGDQKTKGPEDQRTKGPKDQGTRGPRDHGTKGEVWNTWRFKDHKIWKCHKRAKTLHQRRKCEYFLWSLSNFSSCLNLYFSCPFFGTPCHKHTHDTNISNRHVGMHQRASNNDLSVIKFNPHFPWQGNLKIGKLSGPVSQNHVSILDFRTRCFAPSILHFTVDALHSPEVWGFRGFVCLWVACSIPWCRWLFWWVCVCAPCPVRGPLGPIHTIETENAGRKKKHTLTLYTPHFTLYTPESALHILTLDSTLSYALHCTLHFPLHTLNCTLHTSHFTSHSPLCTPQFPTSYPTRYIPQQTPQ